ncbi:hypothetical protein ABZX85_13915 [Streptomyces sp. NPDC004539]|uniref:phosphorylase family protein n=1 Tax=Streptomyces sp. NPDC004539 TaxID=3154280 RepID=UPI0033BBBF9A
MNRTADVIIFTALPVETAAVRFHLDGPLTERVVSGSVFKLGTFTGRHVRWTVALHETGPGPEGAAALVALAVAALSPRYVFFTGIAGGLKDVTHGDVVAGRHVYDYQSGVDGPEGVRPRVHGFPTAHDLVQRAQVVAGENEWQARIEEPAPDDRPQAYVKPIAAGSKLVTDPASTTARLLHDVAGDAIAVEMEGYGFLRGAHISSGVGALVVRGVSDLLVDKGSANDRTRQPAAARNAAAFTYELLNQLGDSRTHRPGLGTEVLDARTTGAHGGATAGFGPDDTFVVVGPDGAVERWALDTGTALPGVPGGGGLREGHQALVSSDRHSVAVARPGSLELVHFTGRTGEHRRVRIPLGGDEYLVTTGGGVLATHDRHRLAVRSFDDGRVLRELPCPPNLAATAIDSTGMTGVLATTNRVHVHRPDARVLELDIRNVLEFLRPGCAVAVSPSGGYAVCATLKELRLWRTDDGTVLLHRRLGGKEMLDSAGATGMRLSCTDTGTVLWLRRGKLSQVTDAPEIRQLEQAGRYDDAVVHPSGHLLGAVGDRGAVRVWEWHDQGVN